MTGRSARVRVARRSVQPKGGDLAHTQSMGFGEDKRALVSMLM